jgi:hypothetical protein
VGGRVIQEYESPKKSLRLSLPGSQGHSQGVTGVTVVMGPRGATEGSQKESGPGKGFESQGRYKLFLRKRKKIRKQNQSKGVLRVIGGPGSP